MWLMFIDTIFVWCECGSSAECESVSADEVCDVVSLVLHGVFDSLLAVGGVANDEECLVLRGIFDIWYFAIE